MNNGDGEGPSVYLSLMSSQTLVQQGKEREKEKGRRVAGAINYSESSPLGLLTNKGDAQDKSINPFTPERLVSRLHPRFLPTCLGRISLLPALMLIKNPERGRLGCLDDQKTHLVSVARAN